MFDLRQFVQMRRSTRQAVEQNQEAFSLAEPVKLVAITQSPDDAETLRQIAGNSGWSISIVDSSSALLQYSIGLLR